MASTPIGRPIEGQGVYLEKGRSCPSSASLSMCPLGLLLFSLLCAFAGASPPSGDAGVLWVPLLEDSLLPYCSPSEPQTAAENACSPTKDELSCIFTTLDNIRHQLLTSWPQDDTLAAIKDQDDSSTFFSQLDALRDRLSRELKRVIDSKQLALPSKDLGAREFISELLTHMKAVVEIKLLSMILKDQKFLHLPRSVVEARMHLKDFSAQYYVHLQLLWNHLNFQHFSTREKGEAIVETAKAALGSFHQYLLASTMALKVSPGVSTALAKWIDALIQKACSGPFGIKHERLQKLAMDYGLAGQPGEILLMSPLIMLTFERTRLEHLSRVPSSLPYSETITQATEAERERLKPYRCPEVHVRLVKMARGLRRKSASDSGSSRISSRQLDNLFKELKGNLEVVANISRNMMGSTDQVLSLEAWNSVYRTARYIVRVHKVAQCVVQRLLGNWRHQARLDIVKHQLLILPNLFELESFWYWARPGLEAKSEQVPQISLSVWQIIKELNEKSDGDMISFVGNILGLASTQPIPQDS